MQPFLRYYKYASGGVMEVEAQIIFKIIILSFLTIIVTANISFSQENISRFTKAKQLENESRTEEAFMAYLSILGAEYAAASIGRLEPEKYLKVLDKNRLDIPPETYKLLKGDLLLALDNKQEALKAYQAAVTKVDKNYYPVEVTEKEYMHSKVKPFSYGPGSHKDNWFIRRFMVLESWDDVAKEFKRIWEVYRQEKYFTGLGLEFAIDYAYFLEKQKNIEKLFKLLLEVICTIDMDYNPNLREQVRGFSSFSGISRKEFIRLAYGIFKNSGQEQVLIKVLTDEINSGNNIARRTLAIIQNHKGNQVEALKLELDYIQNAKFDQVTTSYRRGLIFELYSKLEEAASEYEKVLELAYSPPDLPDEDEEKIQSTMLGQALTIPLDYTTEIGKTAFHQAIIEQLNRIYVALGKVDKSLVVLLRQFEINPKLFEYLEILDKTLRAYQATGKKNEFLKWSKDNINKLESDLSKAHLYWILEDYENTAKHLVAFYKNNPQQIYEFSQWKKDFRELGKDKLKILLAELSDYGVKDAVSRLELLELEDNLEGEEAIEMLEIILAEANFSHFSRGKGVYNPTKFRNYYDLAYRLMRLYEKNGKIQELIKLGLRIARAEKPFQDWPQNVKDRQNFFARDENDFPEDISGCFSLLIQYADDSKYQKKIAQALAINPYSPAQAQLARRQQNTFGKKTLSKSHGWANLPKDISLIASNENILSLSYDENYIFTGHVWGVGVYTKNGEPITRIALAAKGLVLQSQDKNLWVGTPIGIYKIKKKDWSVVCLWCDKDNSVLSLELDGNILWIGTRSNIQTFNVKTNELKIFTKEELGVDHYGDWSKFIINTNYVWVEGYSGSIRFDKQRQKWAPILYKKKSVQLIGLIAGELWGYVKLGDYLGNRPCLISKDSLDVTPILIEGNLTRKQRMIYDPVRFYTQKGKKIVFIANNEFYEFNREKMKLNIIDVSELQTTEILLSLKAVGTKWWTRSDGVSTIQNYNTHQQRPLPNFYLKAGYLNTVELENEKVVLGAKLCSNNDWPSDQDKEVSEHEGGLYLISKDKAVQKISAGFNDALSGDSVYSIVFDNGNNAWVITSLGITLLDAHDKVIKFFSREDGLISNAVSSGVLLSDKIYFSSGWGDSCGGLIVYDQTTKVFTSMVESDGLPSNKIKTVKKEKNWLLLEFFSEYQRFGDFRYVRHAPAKFDPIARKLLSGGEPINISQKESSGWDVKEQREELPFLGGYILKKIKHKDKIYLCGTRGLVIIKGQNYANLEFAQIDVHYTRTKRQALIKEAQELNIIINNFSDLRKYLNAQNEFIRVKALATVNEKQNLEQIANHDEYINILTELVNDDNIYVRYTNIYLLSQINSKKIIPALQQSLADSDAYIRAIAALSLARQSIISDLCFFEEILKKSYSYRNLPYGIDSTVGVQVSELSVYEVLAPHANKDIFKFLIQYPLSADDYEPRQKVFKILGKSLQNNPEAAEILLKAYDKKSNSYNPQLFSETVFKYAGIKMLPILHEALLSKDRVIRSNAARACGAISSPSSINHLINGLDLESGLSQASIVWALGELRSEKAVPHLATLYIKVKNDEKRKAGAGFRVSQVKAVIGSQYNAITNLDSISSDENELKALLTPEPIKPREDEELLSLEIILEAVSKIGANATQEFYRKLAGESEPEARLEAAINLSRGNKKATQNNIQILRGLLADSEVSVRIESAVSLLILGEKNVEEYIVNWLGSKTWEKEKIIKALLRVKDYKKLLFAKDHIIKCTEDSTLGYYAIGWAKQLIESLGE